MNYKILNSRERKEIHKYLEEQYDFKEKIEKVFLENRKNKVYLINREFEIALENNLRINSAGLYFGEKMHGELRLSFEGSMIVGKKAKKNIIELNETQKKQWLKGEEIEVDEKNLKGFIILKNKDDILGCGRYSENKIRNYVPKTRRILKD